MPHVYFPLSGLISVMAVMGTGVVAETRTVGREGMLPLVAILGGERSAREARVQVAGAALSMPVAVVREQARQEGPLHDLIERYTAAALLLSAQTTACNGLHTVSARLARWLLLAHDRGDEATLAMSHQLLGQVLGVRRASVTIAAGALQRVGIIRSHYKGMDILDRAGLETASCECYRSMRGAIEQVFAIPHQH